MAASLLVSGAKVAIMVNHSDKGSSGSGKDQKWAHLPPVLFDMMASLLLTKERLLLLERTCRAWYNYSKLGNGWMDSIDSPRTSLHLVKLMTLLGHNTRMIHCNRIRSLTCPLPLRRVKHGLDLTKDDTIFIQTINMMPSLQSLTILPLVVYTEEHHADMSEEDDDDHNDVFMLSRSLLCLTSLQRLELIGSAELAWILFDNIHLPQLTHFKSGKRWCFDNNNGTVNDTVQNISIPNVASLSFESAVWSPLWCMMIKSCGSSLRQLRSYYLDGDAINFLCDSCPSLLNLSIISFPFKDHRLPKALAALTTLQSLTIDGQSSKDREMNDLSQLTTLVHLKSLELNHISLKPLKSLVIHLSNKSLTSFNNQSCHQWLATI
jgi:hypothetical protein